MLFTKSVTPMIIGAGLLAASLTANAEAVKIKLEPYVTGVNSASLTLPVSWRLSPSSTSAT